MYTSETMFILVTVISTILIGTCLLQIIKDNGFTGTIAEFTEHLKTNERAKYYNKTEVSQ